MFKDVKTLKNLLFFLFCFGVKQNVYVSGCTHMYVYVYTYTHHSLLKGHFNFLSGFNSHEIFLFFKVSSFLDLPLSQHNNENEMCSLLVKLLILYYHLYPIRRSNILTVKCNDIFSLLLSNLLSLFIS